MTLSSVTLMTGGRLEAIIEQRHSDDRGRLEAIIEQRHSDDRGRLEAIIEHWLKVDPSPTWRRVIDALEEGYKWLAKYI